jgi:two-component system, OmpR family, KDP operon response regulator KdpE
MRLLVVGDDPWTKWFVVRELKACGYEVVEVATAHEAIVAVSRSAPHLIILDRDPPDMDGMELILEIRARAFTPIVVVSARSVEEDLILALDLGASDYLEKPFAIGEFLARVRCCLRNAPARLLRTPMASSRMRDCSESMEGGRAQ